MTNSNPEVDGGGGEPEPVLRQEARKALSGRVPLAMSIALALLSGMLVGYGVRAFTAGQCERRELRCPRQTGARILVMPQPSEEQTDCSKARLHLLHEGAPGSAAAVGDTSAEAPSVRRAPVAVEAAAAAAAARAGARQRAQPVDKP